MTSLIFFKRFIFIALILFCVENTYGQIENTQRKIQLLPPLSTGINNLKISPVNPDYFSPTELSLDKKQDKKSIFESETFLDPADIYLKRNKKNEKKSNQGYSKKEYLGDVKTRSDDVNIICRDFEYVDGDRVRILVNDSIVINNLMLDSDFSGFKLPLIKGFNKIDFTALNQGSSGPNTAELRLYDDKNQMISSNKWNLATGGTATFIIVKE